MNVLKNWCEKYWTRYGILSTVTAIRECKFNSRIFCELLRENSHKIRKTSSFNAWLLVICDILIDPSTKQFLCLNPPLTFSRILKHIDISTGKSLRNEYLDLLVSILVGSDPYLHSPKNKTR